jgi:hypothetical protein
MEGNYYKTNFAIDSFLLEEDTTVESQLLPPFEVFLTTCRQRFPNTETCSNSPNSIYRH